MLKNISIRKYQLQLALILARGFESEELEQILIPKNIHNISCSYTFGDKSFSIDDSYIDNHYIKITINDRTELDCVKDQNSIQVLEYILSKAVNYRNYGNIEADKIVEREVYDNFSRSIHKYVNYNDIIQMEYLILNMYPNDLYIKSKVELSHNGPFFALVTSHRFGMIKFIVGNGDSEEFFYSRNTKVGRAKIVNILHKSRNMKDCPRVD